MKNLIEELTEQVNNYPCPDCKEYPEVSFDYRPQGVLFYDIQKVCCESHRQRVRDFIINFKDSNPDLHMPNNPVGFNW